MEKLRRELDAMGAEKSLQQDLKAAVEASLVLVPSALHAIGYLLVFDLVLYGFLLLTARMRFWDLCIYCLPCFKFISALLAAVDCHCLGFPH